LLCLFNQNQQLTGEYDIRRCNHETASARRSGLPLQCCRSRHGCVAYRTGCVQDSMIRNDRQIRRGC
jgi:hypothetical protein